MENKLGRPELRSPIAVALDNVMEELNISREQLCTTAGIKYPTLMNVWKRARVSQNTLFALKYNGLIKESTEKEYYDWILVHAPALYNRETKNRKSKVS